MQLQDQQVQGRKDHHPHDYPFLPPQLLLPTVELKVPISERKLWGLQDLELLQQQISVPDQSQRVSLSIQKQFSKPLIGIKQFCHLELLLPRV